MIILFSDIQQLNLIMDVLGTPSEDFMSKISSESVCWLYPISSIVIDLPSTYVLLPPGLARTFSPVALVYVPPFQVSQNASPMENEHEWKQWRNSNNSFNLLFFDEGFRTILEYFQFPIYLNFAGIEISRYIRSDVLIKRAHSVTVVNLFGYMCGVSCDFWVDFSIICSHITFP